MFSYNTRYIGGVVDWFSNILQYLRLAGSVAAVLVIVWCVILSVIQVYTILVPGTYEFMQNLKLDKILYGDKFNDILSKDESSAIVRIMKAVILKMLTVVGCIIIFQVLIFRG